MSLLEQLYLYYKIVVLTDCVLRYFLEYSTSFVAKYLHVSNVLIRVAPLLVTPLSSR